MGKNFASGLLAGVTAAVIWMAIAMAVGMGLKTVGLWGLVFLVGTCVVSTIIASAVDRGHRDPGVTVR